METLRTKILGILVLLLCQWMLLAEPIDRKVLIYLEMDNSQLNLADQLIIQQTLVTNLIDQETFQVLQHPGDIPQPDDMDQTALFAGADSWAHIRISGGLESLLVHWEIRDIQEQEMLSVDFFQNNIDSSYLTLYGSFWDPLIQDMESRLIPIEVTGQFQLTALPDSQIIGLGEEPILVGDDGLLHLTLSAPASYSLGLKKPGYYNEQIRFYLEKDEVEILEVQQKREGNFSVYGGLYMFGFPSLALQYQIPRTQIITSLGVDLFFIGFTPGSRSNDNDRPEILGGNGLFYGNFKAGYQFETSKGFFNFPVNLGAFIRVTPLDDTIALVDPLIPWGFYLSGSVEYAFMRNIMICFEWRPSVYYTSDALIYQSSFENRQIQLGENFMLDIPLFVLGVRWYP